ncbi:chaperone protein dnaJ C76, chloroplastic-like [Papaver somniferum]|nr:chaperone protein dnaJ C76, chloroplastic-like [Papaver somniferum]
MLVTKTTRHILISGQNEIIMEPLISKSALYSAAVSNPNPLISNYAFNGFATTLCSSFPLNLNRNLARNQICLKSCGRSGMLSSFTLHCKEIGRGEYPLSLSSAYEILGVSPYCTFAELKSAFRSKVKQYHPDVSKDVENSDDMIRQVITAYEIISKNPRFNDIDRDKLSNVDPFDEPECEALDIFINETLCIGKGCPSSCVKAAPNAFSFDSWTGTARATIQGQGNDYGIQNAVSGCPRNCIHYVTPSQRIILEELLNSILESPVVATAEADILYSLITKAKFENSRYQKPKKKSSF